jgi:hypothetical protein
MLPTQGRCHGVFLLLNALDARDRRSFAEWLSAAKHGATYMSRALDLEQIALDLIEADLVRARGSLEVDVTLRRLCAQADRATLVTIAGLLLRTCPPAWLWVAYRDGVAAREYIPTEDLVDLEWLEPELDLLLANVSRVLHARRDAAQREALGLAGELVVMAALANAGIAAAHVSLVSDMFGYDIECGGLPKRRIEVKSASEATMREFHLSRNEFDQSQALHGEWELVQVVFNPKVFVADVIDPTCVACVRTLAAAELDELVAGDTPFFRWEESAVLVPPETAWRTAALCLRASDELPSLAALSARTRSEFVNASKAERA